MELEVPACALQRQLIKQDIKDDVLQTGKRYFLISRRWFKLWKEYVLYDDDEELQEEDISLNSNPGQIDNSDLIDLPPAGLMGGAISVHDYEEEQDNLRQGLQEEDDYLILSETAWNLLKQWYGGGPTISRIAIEEGQGKHVRVEVYPLCLTVCKLLDVGLIDTDGKQVFISKKATVEELKTLACKKFDVELSQARLWNIYGDAELHQVLDNESATLEECAIVHTQRILLEVKKDGVWPRDPKTPEGAPKTRKSLEAAENGKKHKNKDSREKEKEKKRFWSYLWPLGGSSSSSTSSSSTSASSSSTTSSSSSSSSSSASSSSTPSFTFSSSSPRGLCGLHNLGNTCFMNSALQCLSNTAPLTEYFLLDTYKKHINRTNPLGMKGKVAEEYGHLLKDMWSGSGSVAPRSFKLVIGKFAPQFNGYSQHDSQELLAFLLDGLHEDLNRVLKKPYVEVKESDGRPEDVVARESWEGHLRRNQSIIVDLFQGQLKSTLVCPKCNNVSKCWDPFMYLSLPLPTEKTRYVEVIVVKHSETWRTPIKYNLKVDKQGKIEDLKTALKEVETFTLPSILYYLTKHGYNADNLVLADIYNNRVYKFLSDGQPLVNIRPNDVTVAYEVPRSGHEKNMCRAQVLHQREKKKAPGLHQMELFGLPFVMCFEKTSTGEDIYRQLWQRVKRFVKDRKKLVSSSENGDESSVDYPFVVKMVAQTSGGCQICTASSCSGCEIEPNDKALKLEQDTCTLAIQWSSNAIKKMLDVEKMENYKEHENSATEANRPLSLQDCLDLFTTNEKLGANDPWYCPKCKEFQQAMKKFDLWKLPEILVVHLKRFQYTKFTREKIHTMVEFPLEGLDLTGCVNSPEHAKTPAIYDLFAVSNHSGGLGGGHYTAYGKNKGTNKWYIFDDSHCSEVPSTRVQSSAAYVLFYQRRQPSPRTQSLL